MAQPPEPQHRPSFSSQSQSFTHGYPQTNARPQFSPQSPTGSMSYSSPSPQPQFSPTFSGQAPPLKRQRMSPDVSSNLSQPVHPPQAPSPVNGQINGFATPNVPRPISMPPPQQPVPKKEERDATPSVLRDTPMEMGATRPAQTNPLQAPNLQTSFNSTQTSFNSTDTTLRPVSSGGPPPNLNFSSVSQEEREKRDHQRQDWAEARLAQHELWDPFLYGANLNDKIKSYSQRANLHEAQSGVLVNTQKNQPPPTVRVNGLEGATRVISQGQSILDTKERADRLNELVKLLCLSSKARLTGLVQTAARIALERQQHSKGRIPKEWTDVAVPQKTREHNDQNESSPTPSAGMKRTHSQANDDADPQKVERLPKHPAVTEFTRLTSQEMKAEQARQAKRRKRTEVLTARETEAQAQAEADAVAAALDSEKKTTKKERKMAESKVSEQQQHASTNEAARMATANLFGKFANKKKNYSWMTGGGSRTPSAAATPTRTASAAAVPREKPSQTPKTSSAGEFDESSEPGVQARDLLLVLETDGRAARSFVRGSSIVDDGAPRGDS